MRKYLSLSKKTKIVKLIIQRDGGTRCLFCKRELTTKTGNLEHLNGDESYSELDNLAFSCHPCNVRKGFGNDKRLLKLAEAKFDYNIKSLFVGERFPNSQEEEENEEEIPNEIRINRMTWRITKEYLRDKIKEDGSVLYREALSSLVFLCQTRIGHGSENTIRRHLAAFSSPVGPYEERRDSNRQRIIVLRERKN